MRVSLKRDNLTFFDIYHIFQEIPENIRFLVICKFLFYLHIFPVPLQFPLNIHQNPLPSFGYFHNIQALEHDLRFQVQYSLP